MRTERLRELQSQSDSQALFSIGERQLICLCRSLLEGGRILILDEATASLDHATQTLVNAVRLLLCRI